MSKEILPECATFLTFLVTTNNTLLKKKKVHIINQ